MRRKKTPPPVPPKPNRRHTVALSGSVWNPLKQDSLSKSMEKLAFEGTSSYPKNTEVEHSHNNLSQRLNPSPEANPSPYKRLTPALRTKARHLERQTTDVSTILKATAIDPPSNQSDVQLIQTFGSLRPQSWRRVTAPQSVLIKDLASHWLNQRTANHTHNNSYRFTIFCPFQLPLT